ncbi:hypothetical protein GW17_00004076 [Ensete ventricosum]|nr:hypothetical protein GW17_00004076 [Ensete ventricosum]
MSGDSKEGYATGGGEGASSGSSSGASSPPRAGPAGAKQRDKARVSRTSLILWHTHQNDVAAVRKLLEEDRGLVNARDYDYRTPLHVAALHGWIDVAKCLLDHGADVNAQDRWKNTVSYIYTGCPLADAAGAKKPSMIELLKSYGGSSYVSLLHQDFRHEVNLLVKLRHPNIVQFLGAVTERKPLMLITEYLRGGDLHQHLKEKGPLNTVTAINFALDIAR